jgi:hypothetical protein
VSDIDLADLATFEGRTVRVGGRVTNVTAERILIDDGTAEAPLRTRAARYSLDLAPEVGTLVNAIGVATASTEGDWEVVLASLADITTPAGILTVARVPIDAASSPAAPTGTPTGTVSEASSGPGPGPADGVALIVALVALAAAAAVMSLAVFVWWRRRQPGEPSRPDVLPETPGVDRA